MTQLGDEKIQGRRKIRELRRWADAVEEHTMIGYMVQRAQAALQAFGHDRRQFCPFE